MERIHSQARFIAEHRKPTRLSSPTPERQKRLHHRNQKQRREQIKSGSVYQAEEIIILHDGTNAYLSEYALVRSGVNLSAFNADVSGGNLRLLVTPVNSVTTYKATCTGMRD